MGLYMLDTDTASYLIRGKVPRLDERIATIPPEKVCLSTITRAELLYGIRLKENARQLAQLIAEFLTRIRSLPWDDAAADHFASVAAVLTKAGTPIGTMDTMIAAHAMAAGAILITNNERHYSRVPDLNLQNWTQNH